MSGWKWVIQPLLTVERTVERAPGCWPLSSPCRRRRWPAGQALQGPSIPGYDRHWRTDGLGFTPIARAKHLAARYITHSKFNRAKEALVVGFETIDTRNRPLAPYRLV